MERETADEERDKILELLKAVHEETSWDECCIALLSNRRKHLILAMSIRELCDRFDISNDACGKILIHIGVSAIAAGMVNAQD